MGKYNSGDEIELTEGQRIIIKSCIERCEIDEMAFRQASASLKESRQNLWATVATMAPEIYNRYHLHLDHKTFSLRIVRCRDGTDDLE